MDEKLLCRIEPVKLRETDSLSVAIRVLTENRLSALPVVNERDELVGTIGVNGLLEKLLPRSILAVLERGDDVMPHLSFMADNTDELSDKLHELADMPVGELADRNAPVIYPDSPAMEAVLLLLRGEDDVPVVERETRKFRCMVSALDLLHTLQEGVAK
jgi:CBS domain-containing protein